MFAGLAREVREAPAVVQGLELEVLVTELLADRKQLVPANQTIRSIKLYHRQIYGYAYHRPKLDFVRSGLLDDKRPGDASFAPLADFLEAIPTTCPHDLFQREDDPKARASQATPTWADASRIIVNSKRNAATETAELIIPAVGNNKLRHETLQRFGTLDKAASAPRRSPKRSSLPARRRPSSRCTTAIHPETTKMGLNRCSSGPSHASPPLRRTVLSSNAAKAQSFEPPSTWMVSPVIHRASSDARKATTPPMSSGCASRLSACMPKAKSRPASVLVKFDMSV